MQIVWNSEAVQRAAELIAGLREQIATSLNRSRTVREVLTEADPAGDNRRLRAIVEEFERVLIQLRQAGDDADDLCNRMRFMIETFDGVENEAIEAMKGLETGSATYAFAGDATGMTAITANTAYSITGVYTLPKAVVGPHMSVGFMASMPKWLADSMAENYFR